MATGLMIDSILLIRPRTKGKMEFPFGLLYTGTALKNKGWPVKVIDLHAFPEREFDIEKMLLRRPGTMLGISALSGSYFWVKEFTLRLKKKIPGAAIVIGGHIAAMHSLLLEKTGVDYVCLGEGESTLPALIEEINKGGSLSNVPGIAFRQSGRIIKTDCAPLLSEFPFPDFSLLDIERYFIHPSQDSFFVREPRYLALAQPDDKMATLIFSRGCLGKCNFCYRHLPGYRQAALSFAWRLLMKLYRDYRVRYFRIDDELFTANRQWLDGFCRRLKQNNVDILFRITGLRVDIISNELLLKLKEMGCIGISYGIESGSQKTLDRMNKGVTVEQNRAAIKKTIAHGMQAMAYVMFGYQGETKDDLEQTLALFLEKDVNPTDISLCYTIPLPGTKLYQDCLDKGLIKDEESFMEELCEAISEQRERYLVKLGELTKEELFGFEDKFRFLLSFKKIFRKNTLALKAFKKIVFLVPWDSKVNAVFAFGCRVLEKFRALSVKLQRLFRRI